MRLDKYLADALGLPRSQAKQYLKKKRVTVNGELVTDGSYPVAAGSDRVVCMDEPVIYERYVYYMFHKPAGCVTAREDREHPTVFAYVKDIPCRDLFAVGRLDKDTEGLLLFTNDGKFDHALMSPKRHVEKTYYFEAEGTLTPEEIGCLERGVSISEKEPPTAPARLRDVRQKEQTVSGFLTITEGRFHQVKRMLHAVGCQVTYLKRTAIGPVPLDEELPKGGYRRLTDEEIRLLLENPSQSADGGSDRDAG
ncbi:MAG: rRNA pseudouridine synthase [Lachnospiraceae bacterium]|nr:rRNA pseudouridine synthase [Lachnospiraceae bacterium]